MKTVLCAFTCVVMITTQGFSNRQNYAQGDLLQVAAQSGLRLRTAPDANAGTISVLACGEAVEVLNTFNFDSLHQGTSGWYQGHWIYVRTVVGSGYVFDVYLSSLQMPNHENELCEQPFQFTQPLQSYLEHHYPLVSEEQGFSNREDIDQCIFRHTEGITVTRTTGSGWLKTDLVFQQRRMSEVINLFRNMLIGKDIQSEFDKAMVFHTDNNGNISRVKVALYNTTIQFEHQGNDAIHVALTDLTMVDRS